MDLKKELRKLKTCGDPIEFNNCLKKLYNRFPENKDEITAYVEKALKDAASAMDKRINELSVKVQLVQNAEILPLSYIAKHYFKKTKGWIYQRINGNIVNGKPAQFTDAEKEVFNKAVRDISNRIGSISIV